MTGWRRFLRMGLGILLAVTLYFVAPMDTTSGDLMVRLILSVLTIGVLTAGIIWQVVRHIERPELRVDGLVFGVVVAVLVFALAFYRVELSDPSQFADLHTRLDSLYFALSTLLTVGFGDVHAVGQVARGLVVIAMMFNVLVVATAVTTLSNSVRRRAQQRVEERRLGSADDDHAPSAGTRRTHRKPR